MSNQSSFFIKVYASRNNRYQLLFYRHFVSLFAVLACGIGSGQVMADSAIARSVEHNAHLPKRFLMLRIVLPAMLLPRAVEMISLRKADGRLAGPRTVIFAR